MAFLFNRNKSPADLVKSTISNIDKLGKDDCQNVQKVQDKISANLLAMKKMMYGDVAAPDGNPKKEQVDKLEMELFSNNLPVSLIQHMKEFEFEARKDVAQVCNFLIRRGKTQHAKQQKTDPNFSNQPQIVRYIDERPQFIATLVGGYNAPEIALNCGAVLRECIRHEYLCKKLLMSSNFDAFFEFVQKSNFDVASDAFATFKMMLTRHKPMVAEFLETNYDMVITKYNELIQSRNYVTKRQSLKLLGEILLDRVNFKIMIRYINDSEHLKIMMNLLKGKSKTIQFEAFHVFKVFVANPKKSEQVLSILTRNKDRLIDFLERFQQEKDDEQFKEEKEILLKTLKDLQQPEEKTPAAQEQQ